MSDLQSVTTDVQRADQLLTVADVAGRIGAHEQTVRGWIKTGELKAARFGTRIGYRIKRSDDEDFLHRRTLTGAIAAQLLRGASAAPDA
jgi:excisionase family DNA binding protein